MTFIDVISGCDQNVDLAVVRKESVLNLFDVVICRGRHWISLYPFHPQVRADAHMSCIAVIWQEIMGSA
jgi:hypothetical protein